MGIALVFLLPFCFPGTCAVSGGHPSGDPFLPERDLLHIACGKGEDQLLFLRNHQQYSLRVDLLQGTSVRGGHAELGLVFPHDVCRDLFLETEYEQKPDRAETGTGLEGKDFLLCSDSCRDRGIRVYSASAEGSPALCGQCYYRSFGDCNDPYGEALCGSVGLMDSGESAFHLDVAESIPGGWCLGGDSLHVDHCVV